MMNKISSKELRNAWIRFYEERGHINIGAVSLIGDGTTGVMFNVAGMQPLMPYLLGKDHPSGKKRRATCRAASARWISKASATRPISPSSR